MKRFFILIALAVVVYFSNLGGTSIYVLDEAKNAGCAMEMYSRNDLVVPTFNNELRTDKPPLHYFMMMLSYSVFGITPFAARFFSAVCGVLLIVFLYRKITKILSERTAFLTCLVLLSSLQMGIQFHLAVPDPYLILSMTICLFSFYTGYYGSPNHFYIMYISAALAFLTKGLIAIVFPAIVIFLYLIYIGQFNWKLFQKIRLGRGTLVFLLISVPWYAAVGYATRGDWLKGFFISHNIERYTSTMEGHDGFPLSPFIILFASLLPFSVFIIQACRLALRDRHEHPFLIYCLIVAGVIAVFFSFSKTMLPNYPAPAIPFLSVVLGNYLNHLLQKQNSTLATHLSIGVHMLIALAVPIVVYIALQQEVSLSSLKQWSLYFCVLPVGSLAAWVMFIRSNRQGFVYLYVATWITTLLTFFYIVNPKIDERNPISESLSVVREKYPDHKIFAYKQFNPAYVFALKRPIAMVAGLDSISIADSASKKIILTRQKYESEFHAFPSLKVIYKGKDLFEKGETLLLAN